LPEGDGAAREIIEEFKANGAYQRNMEQTLLSITSGRDRCGQWMAYSLVFFGFILIMALAYTRHDRVAGVVAANFLQGKKLETPPSTQGSDSAEEEKSGHPDSSLVGQVCTA